MYIARHDATLSTTLERSDDILVGNKELNVEIGFSSTLHLAVPRSAGGFERSSARSPAALEQQNKSKKFAS